MPFVRNGQLRVIGVCTEKRTQLAPELPTLAETIPGLYANAWYGLFAPAGTPRAIIDKLNAEANAVLKSPELQKRMLAFGAEVGGGTPEDFGRFMASETKRYAEIVRISGAKLD
jgi:tripartite-type tricarboxylate transporter receptor subunit TctC